MPTATAQDPSIDKLLSKLPPPKKLVKSPVQRALQTPDPILRNPLAKAIIQALSARNPSRALSLSHQLTDRYPKNVLAFCLRGAIGFGLRQFGDASFAFRNAIVIQPKSSLAHFGLGIVEAAQGHFGAAMPQFQKVAELEPKSFVGWICLSGCAQRLGRRQESVEYAKRATALAPSVVATWLQLARAEKEAGNKSGTLTAISKAAELSPDSAACWRPLATATSTWTECRRRLRH